MAEIPLLKGKNAKLIFVFASEKLIVNHVDLQITREGDEIADGICGEDRDRLDFETSHYGVEINALQNDVTLIDAFIKEQKAKDAKTIPKDSSVAILITLNNATRAAYQCRDYILGKWKFGYGGQRERHKIALPGRCRYFDKLPTL